MEPRPDNLPRVLIVSSSVFNPYSGGGITLTNLFSGWPRDKLATAHADSFEPDETICRNFYHLSADEIGWVWPLSLLAGHTRKAAPPGGEVSGGAPEPRLSRRSVVQSSAGKTVRRVLGALVCDEGLQDRVRISSGLVSWVEDFRPQLIYTLLGSLGFIRLVRQLSTSSGAGVVVHMMDDWPTTRYKTGMLGAFFHRRAERELRAMLAAASVRLAISQSMCEAYGRRYGLRFLPFHNALDLDDWTSQARGSWEKSATFRMLYSGSIESYAQLESLADVARVTGQLHRRGEPVELTIRAPAHCLQIHRARFDLSPAVQLKPAPEPDEIARVLAGADLLVLPVNFDRRSFNYIRYSFPTKLPAYLASGTPVLAYGPRGVTQIHLAEEQGWGRVVSRRDDTELAAAIRGLMSNQTEREAFGRRGLEIASSLHTAARVRPAFQDVLARAAEPRAS